VPVRWSIYRCSLTFPDCRGAMHAPPAVRMLARVTAHSNVVGVRKGMNELLAIFTLQPG